MESHSLLCIFSVFSQVVEFILPIPLLALITGWPTSQAEPRESPEPGAGASTGTGAPSPLKAKKHLLSFSQMGKLRQEHSWLLPWAPALPVLMVLAVMGTFYKDRVMCW